LCAIRHSSSFRYEQANISNCWIRSARSSRVKHYHFLLFSDLFAEVFNRTSVTEVFLPAMFNEPTYSLRRMTMIRKTVSPFWHHVQTFRSKTFPATPLSSAKNAVTAVYRSGNRPCCPMLLDLTNLPFLGQNRAALYKNWVATWRFRLGVSSERFAHTYWACPFFAIWSKSAGVSEGSN